MQEEESSDDSSSAQPHWCVDCENLLLERDQQRSWDFCEFCAEAICAQCDRSHTCAEMLRKKPRNW
jgi:hypothetical protein